MDFESIEMPQKGMKNTFKTEKTPKNKKSFSRKLLTVLAVVLIALPYFVGVLKLSVLSFGIFIPLLGFSLYWTYSNFKTLIK